MAFRKDNKVKNTFTKISIGLASPDSILENSFGEVLKPETIPTPYNERYLHTKKERMGHTLHFNK